MIRFRLILFFDRYFSIRRFCQIPIPRSTRAHAWEGIVAAKRHVFHKLVAELQIIGRAVKCSGTPLRYAEIGPSVRNFFPSHLKRENKKTAGNGFGQILTPCDLTKRRTGCFWI